MDTNKYSITDIPRDASKGESDDFGISQYEDGLTKFIENANMPVTIALQGEWGSGKTSLMNTLRNRLCEGDNAQFFDVWVNTWEYSLMKDNTSALIDIVHGLSKQIAKHAGSSTVEKLAESLSRFGLIALSAAFNRGTNTVAELLKGDKSSISEIRTKLEEIIDECVKKTKKQGFIFFIDDLDRIDPPVAVQLLELLKNLFTFDNCIFVLAIDYDVVVKGLEPKFGKQSEQNEREFRSFFDKIIQVPFSMPVTKYMIDDFLKKSLLKIDYIDKNQSDDKDLISDFSEISNLSVGTNPRALKRLLNSLLLIRYINPKDKRADESELLVNFALVSIQIAFPVIYRMLSFNPGFDKWNEEMLTKMNLPPTAQTNMQSEEWEKVLFRLCESDFYLRKRFSEILELFNKLKDIIEETDASIEECVKKVISLSSVTNVDSSDRQPLSKSKSSYSDFLRKLRGVLIKKLQKGLPDIKQQIKPQGQRINPNAYIKFSKKDGECWVKLYAQSSEQGIELHISAKSLDKVEKIVCPSEEDFKKEPNISDISEIIIEFYKQMKSVEVVEK